MQYRMKTHMLETAEINKVLAQAAVGSLATVNEDGTPYVVPVHFVHYQDAIYFHGLPKGQKISNLSANPEVCLAVYDMEKLLLDDEGKPCDTNTKYKSVVWRGKASLVDDMELKNAVLREIVKKYTPHLIDKPIPENMAAGTAVVVIQAEAVSGKYYE